METGFDVIDLKIQDPFKNHGIVYVGQYGTSGYAIAAKGYICDFIKRGVPISWTPLKFDDSELSDDSYHNILAKSVIKKELKNIQTIILHCTADLWPTYKKENIALFQQRKIIGYTVWETNKLPEKWPAFINDSVQEVWCPSNYNKEVFESSGVRLPIRVVPHVFLEHDLPRREYIQLELPDGSIVANSPNLYTFYNISELNERKNVLELIEVYCKAFTKKDPVRLILKTHYKDYSVENSEYCYNKIAAVLGRHEEHAPVYILNRNLSESELLALHSLGDCYVSLTRSEAFGLTIFDAFNYGKKIIVPGYGGQVDYLGINYPGLVQYSLNDVKGMEGFTHGYYMQGGQQWAYPNKAHAIELMKGAINA